MVSNCFVQLKQRYVSSCRSFYSPTLHARRRMKPLIFQKYFSFIQTWNFATFLREREKSKNPKRSRIVILKYHEKNPHTKKSRVADMKKYYEHFHWDFIFFPLCFYFKTLWIGGCGARRVSLETNSWTDPCSEDESSWVCWLSARANRPMHSPCIVSESKFASGFVSFNICTNVSRISFDDWNH